VDRLGDVVGDRRHVHGAHVRDHLAAGPPPEHEQVDQ